MVLLKYEYFAKAFIIILIGPLDVKCMVINSALPSSAQSFKFMLSKEKDDSHNARN